MCCQPCLCAGAKLVIMCLRVQDGMECPVQSVLLSSQGKSKGLLQNTPSPTYYQIFRDYYQLRKGIIPSCCCTWISLKVGFNCPSIIGPTVPNYWKKMQIIYMWLSTTSLDPESSVECNGTSIDYRLIFDRGMQATTGWIYRCQRVLNLTEERPSVTIKLSLPDWSQFPNLKTKQSKSRWSHPTP